MLTNLDISTPEAEGISSSDILKLIEYIEKNKINLHSFMLVAGGKIIAEGYYPPFNADFLHRLYSSTKTYVAVAVGMLVTEGKIKLSDKILSFFPEYDTEAVPDIVRAYTVRDALTMATPFLATRQAENPGKSERNPYANEPTKMPGAIFSYGEGADLMARVVERVTGMELVEFLRPLFDRLGIGKDTRCIKDWDGGAWGGSGMLSTLRDFARFAEFVKNLGVIDGEQIIDRAYMEEMTSSRIESNICRNAYSPLISGGYGYLTWITDDGFALRGMGCQEAWCFPKKDFMFVCTGDTMTDFDVADIRLYDAVKNFIYDNIGSPMADSPATEELRQKLANLKMPSYGEALSPMAEVVSGASWQLSPNEMGWSDVRFDFGDGEGSISYTNARGRKKIRFGLGKYMKTSFPETHYYKEQRGVPSGEELDCLAVAEWISDDKLLLRIYITDVSFGSVFVLASFVNGGLSLRLAKRGEFILDDYGGWAIGTIGK